MMICFSKLKNADVLLLLQKERKTQDCAAVESAVEYTFNYLFCYIDLFGFVIQIF